MQQRSNALVHVLCRLTSCRATFFYTVAVGPTSVSMKEFRVQEEKRQRSVFPDVSCWHCAAGLLLYTSNALSAPLSR